MTKGNFVKGVAVGIAAGTAIGIIASPKSKNVRRKAGKFVRAASEIIDDVSDLWR